MSYIMLEGVVCVVIAAGIGTLVFASSRVVMLARQGSANVFRGTSRSPSQTSHFGGHDLEFSLRPALRDGGDVWSSSGESKFSYDTAHNTSTGAEGDALPINNRESMLGDGDAMGVAAQVALKDLQLCPRKAGQRWLFGL